MSKCPLLTWIESQAYDPPSGYELSKYFGAGLQLIAQGDQGFVNNNYRIAYITYYGYVRMYTKHIKTSKELYDNKYVTYASTAKTNAVQAMERLETIAADLTSIWNEYQSLSKLKSSPAGVAAIDNLTEEDKIIRQLAGTDAPGSPAARNIDEHTTSRQTVLARLASLGFTDPQDAINQATAFANNGGASASDPSVYEQMMKKKGAQTNTTIGMYQSVAGLSDRLFNNPEHKIQREARSHQTNEKSFGLAGADSGEYLRQYEANEAYRNNNADVIKQEQDRVGAQFPGIAPNAPPKPKTYSEMVTKPVEQAKYAVMKRMHIPVAAIRAFQAEIDGDLDAGIQTCAMLIGHCYHNEWYVKGLVFPPQEGYHDRILLRSEHVYLGPIQEKNMQIVGWIHSHPTQPAYMSSMDLHLQASYQKDIPEAVAIVCAPKFNQNAIYSLSVQGVGGLKSCYQSASEFHKHENTVPYFDNSKHVTLHYPEGHAKYHSISSDIVPPPEPKVLKRATNWLFNKGLKRYEIDVLDLRRGQFQPRNYIFPLRPPVKDQPEVKPSGARDLPRTHLNKPDYSGNNGQYDPWGNNNNNNRKPNNNNSSWSDFDNINVPTNGPSGYPSPSQQQHNNNPYNPYSPQQQGQYPPQQQGQYPPQQQGQYPPQQQGQYPPQQQGGQYPPQQNTSQQGRYPPQQQQSSSYNTSAQRGGNPYGSPY